MVFGSEFGIMLLVIVLALAVFFLIWSLLPSGKEVSLEFRLGETAKPKDTTSLFLKYSL